jgi:hypothetical protein
MQPPGELPDASLDVYQHLDNGFGREANDAQSQREKNYQGSEPSCARILCEPVHDIQHVQHQPADTEVKR